ncbi:unnamed protein product [Toxocara canis]|uniref:Miff domain-containing protein n=1 Tax=Toxocara canis TaxID=6265 RepID=A0A183U3H7_TOXCA|nr:unnamed protein product [Toxocara canis]
MAKMLTHLKPYLRNRSAVMAKRTEQRINVHNDDNNHIHKALSLIPQPSVTFTDFTVPQTLPTVPPLPEELLNEGRGQRFPTRPTTTKNRIPSTIANDNTNTEPSISSRRISAPIVDLPNLSSMLPERNYRVGSTNQPLASNNVPPTLNIRTFLARRTANERSSSPAAALATGKTTEDPIQAHPLRGTDDLVLRSLSSTTQPSEPTSFDSLGGNTVNIASTLRQLLNSDSIEDITLNDSKGGAKNSVNEPVVLTVDGQTDDNEMVLSDETRRFFGAGIDSDISERNALLRAISDQSSTPTTNIHDEDAYPTDDQQSISSNLATMEVLIPIANEEGAEPVKQTPKTVRLSDDRERFQTRSAIKGKHRSQGTTSGVVTVNGSTVQEDASDDTVDFPDDDTNASSTSTDRPNEIITGYPEETPYPTRRRFIYVTKRPRNFGK